MMMCASVCCLQQRSSSSHQPPSNWVDTIIPSCSSSQSAELSAESGHMSYLGSCVFFFSPLTIHVSGYRKQNHNKACDWSTACHQLKLEKGYLLKGQRVLSFSCNRTTLRQVFLFQIPCIKSIFHGLIANHSALY